MLGLVFIGEVAYSLGLGTLAQVAEELSWVDIGKQSLSQCSVWSCDVHINIAKSECQALRDRVVAMLQVL